VADPILKEAMAEIRAILNKHDIGGAVALVSPTHSEFLYHLTPSWSVCYFEAPSQLRLRAKRADFKTKAEQKRCVESSAHMVYQLRDLGAQTYEQMVCIADKLERHFTIDANFEPHVEQ
jgi:hypothetical protein